MEEVLKQYPSKQAAKEGLSAILSIGKEPCSRRMRNQTMLSPDEISKICRHFGISIDPLIQEASDNVIFNYNTFIEPVKNFEEKNQVFVKSINLCLLLPYKRH